MLVLANLPALLLVLNLAGEPGDEKPVGSAVQPAAQPAEQESRDVGFARLHMNREIRFVAADAQARETMEKLESAGRPASARGLPNRIEPGSSSLLRMEICDLLRCPRR